MILCYKLIIFCGGVDFSFKIAQISELPLYKTTYDLFLAIFQVTKEFSKEYK